MLRYKEYFQDNATGASMRAGLMPLETYREAHRDLVIFCHDIFIAYQGGILLVTRNNEPAKGQAWAIGGRVLRGMTVEESAAEKTFEETGLRLVSSEIIGVARTLFGAEPFGHGRGTDTVNVVLFGRGEGKVKLDRLHENPLIVRPQDYTAGFRKKLSPYINDYLEAALEKLEEF